MQQERKTGRYADKRILENSDKRVTTAFTCPSSVKLDLINEAEALESFLSMHIEGIIMNRHEADRLQDELDELKKQMKIKDERILNLKRNLSFYENPNTLSLLEKWKDKSVNYIDYYGISKSLIINNVRDFYRVCWDKVRF
jgi:hypothetical protein